MVDKYLISLTVEVERHFLRVIVVPVCRLQRTILHNLNVTNSNLPRGFTREPTTGNICQYFVVTGTQLM